MTVQQVPIHLFVSVTLAFKVMTAKIIDKGDFNMLAGFNSCSVFNAVLVAGIGMSVVRIFYIVSSLIECMGESRLKNNKR